MQSWLLGLAQAGVGAGLTAVLLALAQRPLRRRIPARWTCAVWLLLTLRLLIVLPLPGLVRLPLPLFSVTGPAAAPSGQMSPAAEGQPGGMPAGLQPEENRAEPGAISEAPPPGGQADAVPTPEQPGRQEAPAAVWLFAVWAVGCAGVLAWQLSGHIRYRNRLLRWALPPSKRQRQALAREMAALGLHRRVRLVASEDGPLLMGLLHPVLALPPLPETDGPENGDLALTLRHELAHLARHDLAFKALLTLACALHWADPFVWWMARRASAELELACDELVTRNATPAERRCYGEAIIAAASRRGLAGPPLGTGFWGGRTGLRRRFEQLVDGPAAPKRAAALLCGGLAALVLAASWLLGAFGPDAAEGGAPDDTPAAPAEDPAGPEDGQGGAVWQPAAVDFALNAGAYAVPVYDKDGETILAMQCEKPAGPESWQAEAPAVRLSLELPAGWRVWPAAEGEEICSSGNGLSAPFNLADAAGEWVGTMQYGWFTTEQVQDAGGFYGTGSHAAYYWLWAQPGGFGWDENSCRAAAEDAFLADPAAAGALLCETAGPDRQGHEGILAHDGALGRFVAIELRAGVLSEQERMRLAESIRLLAGETPADTVQALPDEPALPAGYAWQEAELGVPGSRPVERVTVRLALPEGCSLQADVEEEAIFGLPGAGALILRGGETVGRLGCGGFDALEAWPPENPRMVYSQLMLSNHAGWDFDYREIARSETVSIALCLVGREASPRGPGPEAPRLGQEPENFADGWWYEKGILCCDNSLGVFAAIELEYGEFSDAVRGQIAGSVRLAAG